MTIAFNNDGKMSTEDLAVGDKFAMISYCNGMVYSASQFTVDRVLKREIVCVRKNGEESKFSKGKMYNNCHLPDSPAYLAIREKIRNANKIRAIASHLRDVRCEVITGDEEFMLAVESFLARIDDKKVTALSGSINEALEMIR